jgi:extracellular factor (EF) 3-hydroxypalmitic acid methyl ester biosynthesis protein
MISSSPSQYQRSQPSFHTPRTRRHTEENLPAGLLADLGGPDIEWLLSIGVEQHVPAEAVVIEEGETPDALYFVVDGRLEVYTRTVEDETLALIGPGEIVGEMSFLEDKPAAATVRATEKSLLLRLSRAALDAKIEADQAFAVRLYRSFARGLSRRLRSTQGTLGRMVPVRTGLDSTSALIDSMKRTLAEADLLAIRNDEQVPEGVVEGIRSQFQSLCDSLNTELGDGSEASPELKAELGDRVQREILPYMMLTKNGERWYSKPRGYAGDFLSIEWMYQDRAEGVGRLGPVLDRCFLDVAAAKAVRNRRGLLVEEIQKTMSETEAGRPTRVLSMACGPAREIFDTYATLSDPNQLHATCLDIDLQALAFVADVRDKRKLKRHIRLENANLAYLVTGRQRMELQPLDLAYSIGLIDYFNDEFVVRLLDFVHDQLRPGGRVILGNFHPRNSSKAFMDYVLDWKLIHRDEADMNRLFKASKFGTDCEEIRFEEEGINLFAIGRRAGGETR